MKRKLILYGLGFIVVATFVEISLYFVAGKSMGLATGIPSISDIFSPIILSPYIKQAEESKNYYPQRFTNFTNDLGSIISSKSSFVKTAEAVYTLGGTVSDIKPISGTGGQTGYDITLKNSRGDTLVVHLSSTEVQYAKVFLRDPTSFNITRSQKLFSDIKVGDYLVIKKSTNLLNPGEVNLDVEILSG